MTGTRMSHLPVAQFCGKAPALSDQHGAGRAAAMSTYFHALCSGAAALPSLRAKLTDEELGEVGEWHKPKDIVIEVGEESVTLDYKSAEKELEVMLTDEGEHTFMADKAVTIGHLDFAWSRTVGGSLVAYVADIKKSKWTVPDPRSLQIMAYGWAFARKIGADAFVPGIWAATEGEWIWGDWFDMLDFDSTDLWLKIKHAALNHGEYSTGAHCRNCYARMHCPEYLFPAHERMNAMAAFAEGIEPSSVQVADAYLAAQAMEDIAKRLKENVKEYARRGGEIVSADGKRLVMSERAGRAGFDAKGLAAENPELAARFQTKGAPFVVPMWK